MSKIVVCEYEKAKHREDVLYIAENMRAIDRFEVKAFGCKDVLQALEDSISNSEVSVLVKGEKPLCVLGLSLVDSENRRAVWLLGVDDMKSYKKEFLCYGYLVLTYWFSEFGAMYNYISVDNDKSIRWLKWLGASFSEPFLLGGQLFREFILDERSF